MKEEDYEKVKELLLDWRDGNRSNTDALDSIVSVLNIPEENLKEANDIELNIVTCDAPSVIGGVLPNDYKIVAGGTYYYQNPVTGVNGTFTADCTNSVSVIEEEPNFSDSEIEDLEKAVLDFQEEIQDYLEDDTDKYIDTDYRDDNNVSHKITTWTGGFQGWDLNRAINEMWQTRNGENIPLSIMRRQHIKNALMLVNSNIGKMSHREPCESQVFTHWKSSLERELMKRNADNR